MEEWPPHRLDWEMYRIEHLLYVSNMEASLEVWLQYPWHAGYAALRSMACQNWHHTMLVQFDCNQNGVRTCGAICQDVLSICIVVLGAWDPSSMQTHQPLQGATMIPTTADLLKEMYPNKRTRDSCPSR